MYHFSKGAVNSDIVCNVVNIVIYFSMVFISHSSRDAEVANFIVKYLEDSDIKCWVAPRDIPAGA